MQNRWLERAWTFQEWMLSPRVLHIDSMTLWDCFDGYANELTRRYMGKIILSRNPREFGATISWQSIVEEHSGRQVTREDDRLPALAGLATRFAQITGWTYLAGMWREEMPRSLLWAVRPDQLVTCRRAPSWSWASLNASVEHPDFGSEERFTASASIQDVFCQFYPLGSISAVEKAWIDIDGHVSVVTKYNEELGVEAAGRWWRTRPDHGDGYLDNAIAKGNVYLLLLGAILQTYNDVPGGIFGALVVQKCGWEDDHACFLRLGHASLGCSESQRIPGLGRRWEAGVFRLT